MVLTFLERFPMTIIADICKTPVVDGIPLSCELYKGYDTSDTYRFLDVNYCVDDGCNINIEEQEQEQEQQEQEQEVSNTSNAICGVTISGIKDCEAVRCITLRCVYALLYV